MSGLFWRILFAVVGVALVFALLPPILRIFGLDFSADVQLVVRICVGAIALYYVVKGPDHFPVP